MPGQPSYYGQPPGYPQYPPMPQYGQPMPPQSQTPAQWTGGAAFKEAAEKRPSLSFKDAPIGTRRIVVCDVDPIVIHSRKWDNGKPGALQFWDDGNPRWAIGTGFIDENGQPVTWWTGRPSAGSAAMIEGRNGAGIGPDDSMIGWIAVITFTHETPTAGNPAKQYNVTLHPLETHGQYLTPNAQQAVRSAGIATSAPGNRALAETSPPTPHPAEPTGNGWGQQPTYAPPQGQFPQGGQFPAGPIPGPSYGTPATPPFQSGQFPAGQPMPPTYQQAPIAQFPVAPIHNPPLGAPTIQEATQNVANILGGQEVKPSTDIDGYGVKALAAFMNLDDLTLQSMGQDVARVRAAIQAGKSAGQLPNF